MPVLRFNEHFRLKVVHAALTVTERVSTGTASNAFCNSADEEKNFRLMCRAGNRNVSEGSANGYGFRTKCLEPAGWTWTGVCAPSRAGSG